MRYLSSFAAAVIVLLAALFAPAAAAPPQPEGSNLVLNGGAEEAQNGEPAGWDKAWIPAPGLTLARDTRQAKSGKASFLVQNSHDFTEPVANNWRQDLKRVPDDGAHLQITAFMKTSLVEDAANICLQCWDEGSRNMLGFASTNVLKGDNDWTEVRSDRVRVPRGTKVITVRAALRGKGKVWFDDIAVKLVAGENASSEPTSRISPPLSPEALDQDLLRRIEGKVIEVLPIERDQMVLAYLPDWAHGRVDNIAVANNDGGVRTLLAWPAIDPKHAEHRFMLALYARQVVQKGQPGPTAAYEVLDDWDEQTAWKSQPKTADQPAAQFPFENSKGWRLFDVTDLAAAQLRAQKPSHGVLLRFKEEDRTSDNWSGYAFVSREGDGEWADKRPLLLVVQ
jgi:hypothetical protein